MAEILRRLVADGRAMQEWHNSIYRELQELRNEVHKLRTVVEDRLPPLSSLAMDEDTPRTG
jgi:hypothetical protein